MDSKVYIVGWTDEHEGIMHEVFITNDPNKVAKWCVKFNKILLEYKKFLKQFEMTLENGTTDIKEEYFDEWYSRWSDINIIEGAAYKEIEFR